MIILRLCLFVSLECLFTLYKGLHVVNTCESFCQFRPVWLKSCCLRKQLNRPTAPESTRKDNYANEHKQTDRGTDGLVDRHPGLMTGNFVELTISYFSFLDVLCFPSELGPQKRRRSGMWISAAFLCGSTCVNICLEFDCSSLLALENSGVIAAGINKGLLSSVAICLRLTVGETAWVSVEVIEKDVSKLFWTMVRFCELHGQDVAKGKFFKTSATET